MAIFTRLSGALGSFLGFRDKKKERSKSPRHFRRCNHTTAGFPILPTYSASDILIAQSMAYHIDSTNEVAADFVQSIEVDEDDDSFDANANLVVLPKHRYDRLKALQALKNQDFDIRARLDDQAVKARKMIDMGWEQDTIILYMKLARRGDEPYFDVTWLSDLENFPKHLFTTVREDTFIRSIHGSEFRGMNAFDKFCIMGQAVRESMINHTSPRTRPEAVISRHIKAYLKWAWEDAKLTDALESGEIPNLLTVVTGRPGMTTDEIDTIMVSRLRCRAAKLKESLAEQTLIEVPPTLFGIAIFDTILGVVAYEPQSDRDDIRSFAFYDMCDINAEVWNTISLGIIIHYVRNQMIRLKEARESIMDPNEALVSNDHNEDNETLVLDNHDEDDEELVLDDHDEDDEEVILDDHDGGDEDMVLDDYDDGNDILLSDTPEADATTPMDESVEGISAQCPDEAGRNIDAATMREDLSGMVDQLFFDDPSLRRQMCGLTTVNKAFDESVDQLSDESADKSFEEPEKKDNLSLLTSFMEKEEMLFQARGSQDLDEYEDPEYEDNTSDEARMQQAFRFGFAMRNGWGPAPVIESVDGSSDGSHKESMMETVEEVTDASVDWVPPSVPESRGGWNREAESYQDPEYEDNTSDEARMQQAFRFGFAMRNGWGPTPVIKSVDGLPAGEAPDESPVDSLDESLKESLEEYHVNYWPREKRILQERRRRDMEAIGGEDMQINEDLDDDIFTWDATPVAESLDEPVEEYDANYWLREEMIYQARCRRDSEAYETEHRQVEEEEPKIKEEPEGDFYTRD
jgi:hypothetical protein